MRSDQPDLFMNDSESRDNEPAKKEIAMELKEMIEQEYNKLQTQRKELENKIAEIDKDLEPILAYMKAAGKKEVREVKKRGRKLKTAKPVTVHEQEL